VDGEEISRDEKALVMLGNCRQYAGRLNPIRYARMDSGLIDVLVMPAKTALGVASHVLAAWFGGSHLGSRHVRYRTGKVVVVEFQEPCAWEVDGDPPPEKDRIVRLEARVRPGGLPVVR
jgi:diacylglycerol kinase family enzyme